MKKLTEKELQAIKPALKGKKIFDDGGLRGTIRVTKDGAVSVFFTWRYKFEGKSKDLACGTWPKARLTDIRKNRDHARRILEEGKDPALERKAEKLETKIEQQARIAELKAQDERVTVRALYDRWVTLEINRRKDAGAELRRGFEKDVLPAIGAMAAEDVSKAHITGILDAILARGANRLANRTLSELRQMFGFGFVRDIVKIDPTHRIRKQDIGGKEVERDRTLSDSEIRELAQKLPQANFLKSTECAIWIMLATCCRIGELSRAQWQDVDFESRIWTIPPENSKNAKAHTIYLSDIALSQFEALRSIASSDDWIFLDRSGKNHVCTKSITKQIRDRQRLESMSNRTKNTGVLLLSSGEWTPHDLRRTGATLMGELGIRPDVIERCLNHIEQKKVTRTYQRQELKAEQKEAWRLLGARLDLLTRTDSDNVVPLSRFRA